MTKEKLIKMIKHCDLNLDSLQLMLAQYIIKEGTHDYDADAYLTECPSGLGWRR